MIPPARRVRPALVAFGQRVRQARHAAQITQKELAQRAFVSDRFISEIERGKENPSLASIVLLADALGCEVVDLFPRAN